MLNKTINPVCKNCRFYVPFIYKGETIDKYAKCMKFIKTDNKHMLPYANIMRKYDLHCGQEGKYFIKFPVKPSIDL